MTCKHMDFIASVGVGRIFPDGDDQTGEPERFSVEVRANCATHGPTISVDGQEMLLAARRPDTVSTPMQRMAAIWREPTKQ